MDPVSEAPHRSRPTLEAVPALLIPGALGLVLGVLGERTPVTAMLLWLEPLLLGLGAYGVLALILSRRPRMAFGLALGLGLMASGARLREQDPAPPWTPPDFVQELRGCALATEPISRPVRLLVWTVSPATRPDLEALVQTAQPDLVLIGGTADPDLGASLQEALGGEVLTLDADRGPSEMLLAVRGAFQYCGEQRDSWVLDLQGETRAVLSFPEVAGVGILPLMAVHLEGPGGPDRWAGWSDRLATDGHALAGIADALGSRDLVMFGDLRAPSTFTQLRGTLRGAGLAPVPTPPTWPARVGPLPMLPLHTLDQVWAGEGWQSASSRALESGGQPRAPILVELTPARGTASR